ncbi:cation:proton antiporter [Candidatus Bathyarchaeota archaeon]|nr:cation:proton antiporter [Candidatus Bathyarchaeota archaeon]
MLCFGFAGVSGILGLSPLVGAFIVGMAVADSRFSEDVADFTEHLGVLFIPLFFIVAGSHVNPYVMLSDNFYLVGILGIIAVVSKLYGCGIPAQWFLKDKEKGIWVGYGMISRGGIGLVISNNGKTYGIITNEIYAALIFVIFFTTLLPPLLFRNSYINDPTCILPDHLRKGDSNPKNIV